MTASCGRMFTRILPMARIWWSTGIGHRFPPIRRPTGRGSCRTILEPNRAYAEVSRTAHELEKIGPHLVDLKISNPVAILWSRDSLNAIEFMPFAESGRHWSDRPLPRRTMFHLSANSTRRSTT